MGGGTGTGYASAGPSQDMLDNLNLPQLLNKFTSSVRKRMPDDEERRAYMESFYGDVEDQYEALPDIKQLFGLEEEDAIDFLLTQRYGYSSGEMKVLSENAYAVRDIMDFFGMKPRAAMNFYLLQLSKTKSNHF